MGELSLERDGRELDVPPYRCHDVLAYLLINYDQPIRRDRLAGKLFPNLHTKQARARLSDHLWLIRSSLPGFEIHTSHDEIYIATGNLWFDCQKFSELALQGDEQSLLQGINLYKGDLVSNLYSDWIFRFREYYRNQYLGCLRKLASIYHEAGIYQKACEILNRLLLEEPLDESAVRQLMRAHVRLGRRGLAIAAYENYRLLCDEQLNVQPENETQILFENILARPTLPEISSVAHRFAEERPVTLIQRSIKALNEGNRFELLNTLKRLSSIRDSDVVLQRDLLYVDDCIQLADIPRAWQLLDTIQHENEQIELRRAILFIEQNKFKEAEQVLTRVLRVSVNGQNRELESNVLLHLSRIKLRRTEFRDALLAINRSIHIATQINQPILVAKGYLQKARIHYRQGINQDAREVLLQAQTLAHNHNFNCLLVEINILIANSFQRSGLYLSAYRVYNKALDLSRDTGMKRAEAQILLGLAASCDFLGRNAECIQALETARTIYSELNDKVGLAKVDYNLAAALPYHDESRCDDAIRFAQSALSVSMETDQKELQAVAHTSLALALWLKGQYQDAIVNYKKSIELHKVLGENNYIPELCAYIGLTHLGMGNVDDALAWTDRALNEQAMLNLSDIVTDIYYARGAVLDASGRHQEATRHYKQAYQTLLEYAKDIEEEDARQAYFYRDPITRRLMKKIYTLGLAPKARYISFKHQTVTQKTNLPDVALTIHAGPSDEALAQGRGNAVLRRTRLERILRQAGNQQVKLSLEELAGILKVSKRTIQRDLVNIKLSKVKATE